MTERWFEYKIQHILEEEGFLVLNPARSKPFDLVAIKEGVVYLIEIKGRKTRYPKEQYDKQTKLAHKAKCNMVIIKKADRGKIIFFMPILYDRYLPIKKALQKHYKIIEAYP